MHSATRAYSHGEGAVSVAVYDDRLEIWSDGTLPFGLRPEDLKRDHLSRPRNPLIAEVFYRRGLVERWGKGTQRLVDLCVRAGASRARVPGAGWRSVRACGSFRAAILRPIGLLTT